MVGTSKKSDSPLDDSKHPMGRLLPANVSTHTVSKQMRRAEKKTVRHAKRFFIGRLDNLKYVRERIAMWLVVSVMILAAIMGQSILDSSQDRVVAAAGGGTYAEGVVGTIKSLNPLYATSSAEVAASRLMFSSLYQYDDTGHLHSDLALATKVNEKATEYTVSLRQDAYWQDGSPLTANDVIYTIGVIKDPQSLVSSSLQSNWSEVTVKKVDDYTVKFQLPPYASFMQALTFPILPSHLLSGVADSALNDNAFSQSPVGSGPFVFKLLQRADTSSSEVVVHMTANQKYYGGSPRVGRFELHAFSSHDAMVKALKTDALSAAAGVTDDDLSAIGSTDYEKSYYSIDDGVYALMNTSTGVFADKNVRLAVRQMLNLNEIRSVAGGNVASLDLPFLGGQVTGVTLPTAIKQDTVAASKLLQESGWEIKDAVWQKKGETLAFTITTTKNSQYERVADAIASQLNANGVKVSVNIIDDTLPNSNFVGDILQHRNFDMLVYELQIGADPDVYAYWHSSQSGVSGYNFTSYKSTIADAALVSARDRIEVKLRSAKYALFAKQWYSDAPAIGLYQQTFLYLHKPSTESIADGATLVTPNDRYESVADWTVNTTSVYKTP